MSAVIEIPLVFGAMVEPKKYMEPEPQMKSIEPSMYVLYAKVLAPVPDISFALY